MIYCCYYFAEFFICIENKPISCPGYDPMISTRSSARLFEIKSKLIYCVVCRIVFKNGLEHSSARNRLLITTRFNTYIQKYIT